MFQRAVAFTLVTMVSAFVACGLAGAGSAFASGCQTGEKLHLDLVVHNGGPNSPNVTITVTNCTTRTISYIQRSKYIADASDSCAGTVTHLPDVNDSVGPSQSKVSNTGTLNPPCAGGYEFKTKLLNPSTLATITKAKTPFVCCPVATSG